MDFNEKLFKQFDKNEDGKISAEELVTIFTSLGYSFSVEEAKDMIKNVGNKDDVITFDEFFQISEDLETSFSIFDTDDNGYISAAELRQKLTEFGLFASDRQVFCHSSYMILDRRFVYFSWRTLCKMLMLMVTEKLI